MLRGARRGQKSRSLDGRHLGSSRDRNERKKHRQPRGHARTRFCVFGTPPRRARRRWPEEEPSLLNPRGALGWFAARAAAKRVALWMFAISARPATETNGKKTGSRAHTVLRRVRDRRDARRARVWPDEEPSHLNPRGVLGWFAARAAAHSRSLDVRPRLAPRLKRTKTPASPGRGRARRFYARRTAATRAARWRDPTRSLSSSIRERRSRVVSGSAAAHGRSLMFAVAVLIAETNEKHRPPGAGFAGRFCGFRIAAATRAAPVARRGAVPHQHTRRSRVVRSSAAVHVCRPCPHGRPGPLGFGLCGRLPMARHGRAYV